MSERILIIEDEEAMATGLRFNFEQEGYEVCAVADGPGGLEAFQRADPPFDAIVLDLMLPGMSGYETCRQIREQDNEIPILVLSARTLPEDKAQAFDCGGDQYMTKPFALPELISRVRNLLERRAPTRAGESSRPEVQFGEVRIDFAKHEVTVSGRTHSPTSLEMQLLRYFVENEGVVLSRNRILEDVWPSDVDVTTRTIDNFVMRLRRLIESDPAEPRHIVSVRGTGYRFLADPEAPRQPA